MQELTPYFWIAVGLAALLVVFALGYIRMRRRVRVLESVVASFDQPLLFYDDRDRLVYHSPGLVLFDKQATRKIRKLDQTPQPDRQIRGEIEIDSNKYRFTGRRLEYAPGRQGTVLLLEYREKTSAR